MMVVIAFVTRKRSRTVNEFLLGGNNMGGIMTAFAYGTTYFSAVIFIGYAGKNGYQFGLGALWIGIGNAFVGSLLAWKVLARRTRRFTHFTGARTMPEMFEKRYDSKHLKLISAVLIFIFLVPYAASVYQGLSYLFELIFGIPFWVVVVVMAVVTALYLFFGGYFATILSDFFQGIIMIVGVVVMTLFVLNADKVGGAVEGFTNIVADGHGFFPSFSNPDGSANGYNLVMLVLLTSFGAWGLPQIVHKFHTVKSNKAITQATYVSTAFALVIGVSAYLVGAFARYVIPDHITQLILDSAEDKIIPMVLTEVLPAGLLGLIVVLVLSASMSTLASLTLAAASSVSVDLFKGYIKKNATEKQVNILMRSLCVAFVAVSVVIAITKPAGIIELMSLSWGTLAGCFLGPYIYGLFDRKATKKGAYSGIITGLFITLVLYIVFLSLKGAGVKVAASYLTPPAIGVAAMALGMLVMPIVSRLTHPLDKALVTTFFDAMTNKEDAAPEITADDAGASTAEPASEISKT